MSDGWLLTSAEAVKAPLLVLAHGAGAGGASPFLERFSALLAARGVAVARFDFAYMARARAQGRRLPPPRAERLVAEYRARLAALPASASASALFIGGKSMGGRVASMLAGEMHAAGHARGLICLGYPFHPPGRPTRLRVDHLKELRAPALVCQGERDPFGARARVEALELSPCVEFCWLPDGDHDFKPRVRSGETWADNLRRAARCCADFILANAG